MTRGWEWSATDLETYEQMNSNDTASALLLRKTLDSYYGNSYLIPTVLSYAILGTAGLLLLVTSLLAGIPELRRRIPRPLTSFSKRPTFSRKHQELVQILPTLTSKKHPSRRASTLSFQLPLRSQTFAIIVIVVVNLVGIIGFYTPTNPTENYYWPEDSTYIQIVRYVSDRTGILSLAQMILVFLLAGRNSPVQLFTFGAISFETQMLLHRWIARMVVLQAVIHSVGYSMYSLFYGKETYYESFSPYFIWGVVCTVLICFMLFGAIRNLRQAGYELFYILHVLFGVLTIVTVYYHIDLLESESLQDYIDWIWAIVAIWVFDFVLRVGKQISLNVGLDGSRRLQFSRASLISTFVTSDPEQPLILRVRPSGLSKRWVKNWSAGYHVFLKHSRIQPYSSHPFTVISVGDDSSPYLDLVVRPQSGFTRKLVGWYQSHPAPATVVVEGPYGHSLDLYHSQLQLVAGGVGITYCLPFFIEEIRKATVQASTPSLKSGTESQLSKEVNLIWAIKKAEMLSIVVPYLEVAVSALRQAQGSGLAASNIRFSITIFLTATSLQEVVGTDDKTQVDEEASPPELPKALPSDDVSSSKSVSEKEGSVDIKSFREKLEALSPQVQVSFESERPDLAEIIRHSHEISGVGSSGKEMAVVTCGPGGLCDDARAISTRLKGVDYYEEGFTW